jgi:hypothetical protein
VTQEKEASKAMFYRTRPRVEDDDASQVGVDIDTVT